VCVRERRRRRLYTSYFQCERGSITSDLSITSDMSITSDLSITSDWSVNGFENTFNSFF